jgi:hypothetical protein
MYKNVVAQWHLQDISPACYNGCYYPFSAKSKTLIDAVGEKTVAFCFGVKQSDQALWEQDVRVVEKINFTLQ